MRYVTRPLTPEARARLAGVVRTDSLFSASWSSTLELLDRELTFLGVRDEFVLQIDCTEGDLRLDGQLRANARPGSPSVAISIESRSKGSLLFTCGRFWSWQENVRAIALGLEALRKVDRYGITKANEQYRGWQALPAGTPMPAAKMTVEEAAQFLAQHSPRLVAGGLSRSTAAALLANDAELARLYWREAAKTLHPDAGGDPADFRRLTEARDIIIDYRSGRVPT